MPTPPRCKRIGYAQCVVWPATSVASKDQTVGLVASDLVATTMIAVRVPGAKRGTLTVPLVTATLLIEANPLPRSCTLTDWCVAGPDAVGDSVQVGTAADAAVDDGGEAVVVVIGAGVAVGAAAVTLGPVVEPF